MTRTFDNITPEMVDEARAKLAEQNIQLPNDQGRISYMGVTANYTYDRPAEQFTISDLRVGFPASMAGYSENKVIAMIEQALQQRKG